MPEQGQTGSPVFIGEAKAPKKLDPSMPLSRREALRLGLMGAASAALAACDTVTGAPISPSLPRVDRPASAPTPDQNDRLHKLFTDNHDSFANEIEKGLRIEQLPDTDFLKNEAQLNEIRKEWATCRDVKPQFTEATEAVALKWLRTDLLQRMLRTPLPWMQRTAKALNADGQHPSNIVLAVESFSQKPRKNVSQQPIATEETTFDKATKQVRHTITFDMDYIFGTTDYSKKPQSLYSSSDHAIGHAITAAHELDHAEHAQQLINNACLWGLNVKSPSELQRPQDMNEFEMFMRTVRGRFVPTEAYAMWLEATRIRGLKLIDRGSCMLPPEYANHPWVVAQEKILSNSKISQNEKQFWGQPWTTDVVLPMQQRIRK